MIFLPFRSKDASTLGQVTSFFREIADLNVTRTVLEKYSFTKAVDCIDKVFFQYKT